MFMLKLRSIGLFALGMLAGGILITSLRAVEQPALAAAAAKSDTRYFEMRTYHTPAGKLDALHARFRDHTTALFKKHGIDNIGYWVPAEGQKGAGDTLVYILAYPSKAAGEASWKAFREDPEWIKAKDASEKDGKLVEKVDQLFMTPTDYSAIK
jgi:hypothetical protein